MTSLTESAIQRTNRRRETLQESIYVDFQISPTRIEAQRQFSARLKARLSMAELSITDPLD